MNAFIVLCLLAGAAGHSFASADGAALFESFKSTFAKKYESEDEHTRRAAIFDTSLARIARKHADGDDTAGVTQFSDLSRAEFKQRLGFVPPNATTRSELFDNTVSNATLSLPQASASADWRTKGAITNVKNQDQCQNCWAHSAVEQIESQWKIAGNQLTTLSVQEAASCTHCSDCGNDAYNNGCTTGDSVEGLLYVKHNGLVANSVYPYADKKQKCLTAESKNPVVPKGFVTGYGWATRPCKEGSSCNSQDEDTLKKYISSVAPASICVNSANWEDYSGGVMTAKACGGHSYGDMDHCVQLVGYTSDYWIVRNSWGKDWGNEGYIYLEMGKNTCSLASYAAVAKVSGQPAPVAADDDDGPAPSPTPVPPGPAPGPGPTPGGGCPSSCSGHACWNRDQCHHNSGATKANCENNGGVWCK